MITTIMPDVEYHAQPQLSSHQLKEFLRSPAHYRALKEKQRKASKAMQMGTCIHMALLEPEKFKASLVWEEACERRSKAGRELYNDWMNSLEPHHIVVGTRTTRPDIDNIVISAADLDNLNGMQAAYYRHGWVSFLHNHYASHKNECSVFQTFEDVQIRGRFDKIVDDSIVVDLKKTQDARPNVFRRDFHKYGYGIQMAFYRLLFRQEYGRNPDQVVIVAIEEQYPHAVMAYEIAHVDLDEYEQKVINGIREFAVCCESNEWPSYNDHSCSILDLNF